MKHILLHPSGSWPIRVRFLHSWAVSRYGVATISRMLKNIGLFCKRDLQKRPIFCKETYIFKHPTHRSHPIVISYRFNLVQPIADRVAQNLEIVPKNSQFSTRRTRILMGFIISTIHYVVLIINPMGRILVC